MTSIYAIKDNVLAIRATTMPVKWERSTFIDELSVHIRKYFNRSATFSHYPNETIPSPDSVNPLPSEKQTIFPGFGPSMR